MYCSVQLIHHVFIIQVQKKTTEYRNQEHALATGLIFYYLNPKFQHCSQKPPTLNTGTLQLQQTETGLISYIDFLLSTDKCNSME